MKYNWVIMRGNQPLDYTLTEARAKKVAAKYVGAVIMVLFCNACAARHLPTIPCNADNCGKLPGGK